MDTLDTKLQFKDNPRKITNSEIEQLERHLTKFGDLSGVVYCRFNEAFVGGNQRSKIFDGCKVTITENYDQVQPDKTVSRGFIEYKGNRYVYREVEFTEEEFREACIAANNDGGKWDFGVLAQEWTKEELTDFGFDIADLENIFPTVDEDELSISNENFEPVQSLHYLKFGNYRIPLSDIELSALNQKANDYFEKNGTLLGFAQFLTGDV
jgi:hypothetical protein